jgi:hypothetical protein
MAAVPTKFCDAASTAVGIVLRLLCTDAETTAAARMNIPANTSMLSHISSGEIILSAFQ